MLKLNKLLALVESSTPVFRKLIADYKNFFEKKQGEFQGVRKTYTPRADTVDLPGERQLKLVVTTVEEKLEYLEDNAAVYLDGLMNIEATNSSGNAKAELKVEMGDRTISFGRLSTLELMKLKSVLEKEGLEPMYATIPVRSDSEVWNPTTDEMYDGRLIYETERQIGIKRTVSKHERILEDPNILKLAEKGADVSRYTPTKTVIDTAVEIGDYTWQHFSGEATHRYKAGILAKRSELLKAINGAIKEANDVAVVESEFSAQQLFSYLHGK